MAFKSLGSLIGTSVSRSKTPDAILALRIRQIAKASIEREFFDFPKDLLDAVKVRSYKRGVLTVSAPQIVAAELQMRFSGLRETINKELGGKIIKDLRLRGLDSR